MDANATLVEYDGQPAGLITVVDITARKQSEDALRASQERLRLAAQASNTGFWDWDLLTNAVQFSPEWKRQLLAFSRKQVLDPVVLDLNEVIRESQKLLGRLIPENIATRLQLNAAGVRVRVDRTQLEQVLMNLAVNARDAMPSGGSLTFETSVVDLDESYAASHYPAVPGRYVMLAVSDTGIGMDRETQSHIFEPFFTTKEKGRGTGLGLATVYGIVKQSGGFLWVYSEPGQGTTFKVYRPVVDGPAAAAAQPPEPESLAGSETVRVVEDSEALRELLRVALTERGYATLVAGDGAEALRLCQSHAQPIHLLLTDAIMPAMGGRELADRIHRLRPDTCVIYISGSTDDAIVQNGVLDPGVNFLQKPFSPLTLARKVRAILDSFRP
jgi:CheY-like chemotaxis protein